MAIRYRKFPEVNNQLKAKFWARVDRKGDAECWPWIGGSNPKRGGYGRFYIRREDFRSHRVAYWLHYGQDPGELDVCHTCDNPICVNPHHLFLGTRADNHRDMDIKGRRRIAIKEHPELAQRGINRWNAKFTEQNIRDIRHLYASGFSQGDIAKRFNSSQPEISLIVRRKTWKHI